MPANQKHRLAFQRSAQELSELWQRIPPVSQSRQLLHYRHDLFDAHEEQIIETIVDGMLHHRHDLFDANKEKIIETIVDGMLYYRHDLFDANKEQIIETRVDGVLQY